MAEPLNATFFLWRKRERSGVILRAMAGFVALAVLLIAAFVAVTWNTWATFFTLVRQGNQAEDPTAGILGLFALFGWIIVFLFPLYLLMASFEAACLRWMIRRETSGLLGLTLDADTWRVYAGYWLWFGMHFVISNIAGLLLVPFYFMAMPGIVSTPGEPDISGIMWLQVIGVFVQFVPIAYFAIRFAPGNAASIARRRFAYFDAWHVTRHRMWELLGSFVVLWLIWFAIFILIWAVLASSLLMQLIPLFTNRSTDPDDVLRIFQTIFTPQGIAVIGIAYAAMTIAGAVLAVAFMGVNARATIAAAQEGKIDATLPDTVEQVFS